MKGFTMSFIEKRALKDISLDTEIPLNGSDFNGGIRDKSGMWKKVREKWEKCGEMPSD